MLKIFQCVAPPDAPQTVVASEITSTEATITWQPPAYNGGAEIIGYYVERSSASSDRWVRQNKQPIPEAQYRADNLLEGTQYSYRVIAVNRRGESVPSQPCEPFTAKKPYGKHRYPIKSFTELYNSYSN